MKTVTNESIGGQPYDGFSVGFTTGSGIDGATLNVRRTRWVFPSVAARLNERGSALSMGTPRALDGLVCILCQLPDNGRQFASVEAAKAFALERGYLRPYFTEPGLRARRIETNCEGIPGYDEAEWSLEAAVA